MNMIAILPVLVEGLEADTECHGILDPMMTPEQLLVEVEIQKTRDAINFYEERVKELEDAVANGPKEG